MSSSHNVEHLQHPCRQHSTGRNRPEKNYFRRLSFKALVLDHVLLIPPQLPAGYILFQNS